MSKIDTDLPEPLRSVGASPLERRLLQAAGSEQPSRELSERMARGLGIVLPAVGSGAAVGAASKTAAAASKAGSGGSWLLPWISGALVTAIAAGAFVATRPSASTSPSLPVVAPASSAPLRSSPPALVPPVAGHPTDAPPPAAAAESPKPVATPTSPRGRSASTTNELANQIALVDAARAALASGGAALALRNVRSYQTEYPNGTFRPEVAAIKIEALVKLGRTAEARALAERFTSNYGPGPLADRVARLVGMAQP
jgi:hypothetical protein